MKTRVLDSWAILEWISGRQPASDIVGKLLSEAEDGRTRLLMSGINVGEVYHFPGTPVSRTIGTRLDGRRRHLRAVRVRWRGNRGATPVRA